MSDEHPLKYFSLVSIVDFKIYFVFNFSLNTGNDI